MASSIHQISLPLSLDYKHVLSCLCPISDLPLSPQTHSLLERHHCHAAKAIIKESGLLDHLLPDERYFSHADLKSFPALELV